MCPQFSLDDIDPKSRKTIIDSMYISDWEKSVSELDLKCTKQPVNNTTLEPEWVKKVTFNTY